jgi:hypothetical protein
VKGERTFPQEYEGLYDPEGSHSSVDRYYDEPQRVRRLELDSSPIVHRSDFTGLCGLRMVINQEAPNHGHFGTGRNGRATCLSAIFPP